MKSEDIVVTEGQLALYRLLQEIGPTTDMDLAYTMREMGHDVTEDAVPAS